MLVDYLGSKYNVVKVDVVTTEHRDRFRHSHIALICSVLDGRFKTVNMEDVHRISEENNTHPYRPLTSPYP